MNTDLLKLIHEGKYLEAQRQIDDLLAKSFDNNYDLAIALFYLSWLQRGRGLQLTEFALATTGQLASVALKTQDPYLIALSLFRRGDVAFSKGSLAQAKADWENAESLFKQLELSDSYEMTWLSYHLALTYRDLHGYETAIPRLQQILNLNSCSHNMKYKIFRELFFCYCYLKEYKFAYQCFETLQSLFHHDGLEIDFKLFRTHLNILKKNFRGARSLLLTAAKEARASKIGRDRYDFSFHMAYLYAQKQNHTRMFHFISKHTDPIYKLQLYEIIIGQGSFEILSEYETLAIELGAAQHIGKAYLFRQLRQISITNGLVIDLEQTSKFTPREIYFLALLATSSSVSKNHIAREVFQDSFYESTYHDPKIYKMVSGINSFGPIVSNQNGNYLLNAETKISIVNAEKIKIKNAANKFIAAIR
ncbi:MAG: hypothetical protein A4S09_17585 [Proteobacteria bacterium SG_bin7]|nr:MAG: hypothetical protein A4S09_17585 [Proteobacteria bacterium SG_bin7]